MSATVSKRSSSSSTNLNTFINYICSWSFTKLTPNLNLFPLLLGLALPERLVLFLELVIFVSDSNLKKWNTDRGSLRLRDKNPSLLPEALSYGCHQDLYSVSLESICHGQDSVPVIVPVWFWRVLCLPRRYYSLHGHVETMAREVLRGANEVPDVEATLWQIPETLPEKILRKYRPLQDQTMYRRFKGNSSVKPTGSCSVSLPGLEWWRHRSWRSLTTQTISGPHRHSPGNPQGSSGARGSTVEAKSSLRKYSTQSNVWRT